MTTSPQQRIWSRMPPDPPIGSYRRAKPTSACVALLGLVTSGCVASGGWTGGIMSDGKTWNTGPKLSGRVHPYGTEGLAVGFEEQMLWRVEESSCCDQWRATGLFGYSRLAQTTGPAVGTEALLVAGAARVPVPGRRVTAFALGGELAAPIRISPGRDPWNADAILDRSYHLVPDVTLTNFFPVEGPHREVRLEIAVGVSLRFQLDSAALP